jgi:flagellar basal-body rod protein FlgF
MPYGLYLSAEGAIVQNRRLEVLANNMANVSTPGFKRDVSLFQARLAQAIQEGQTPPGTHGPDNIGGGVKVMATQTDFSTGPLLSTKNDTDLAINGEGFFVVRNGNKDMLTRAGNFTLTSEGRLTTQDGKPVLSEEGNPIEIAADGGPWQITADGAVSQAGESIRLALVRPRSYGDLVKAGDNLFAPLVPPTPVPDEERHVVWHEVEQSTVKPSTEMMELIDASRAFETNVTMIHTQDEMLASINGLLRQT